MCCVCVSKEARLFSFAFDVLFYNELSVDNELREPDGKREREKEKIRLIEHGPSCMLELH